MRTRKKMIVITVAVVLVLAGGLGGYYLWTVNRYQNAVAELRYGTADIAQVPTGTYQGSCDVGMISATVDVSVVGGRITKVEILEHKNERGAPAEAIVGEVVKSQSLEVDTVSGATNSSRVLLTAIDNALANAQS